jgi:hypothetical protein
MKINQFLNTIGDILGITAEILSYNRSSIILHGAPRLVNYQQLEKIMLKTYNAILNQNRVQWLNETPNINLGNSIEVQITLLEETEIAKSNGQKMAEALKKVSENNIFTKIDPLQWQQETRQDRSLPHRD